MFYGGYIIPSLFDDAGCVTAILVGRSGTVCTPFFLFFLGAFYRKCGLSAERFRMVRVIQGTFTGTFFTGAEQAKQKQGRSDTGNDLLCHGDEVLGS